MGDTSNSPSSSELSTLPGIKVPLLSDSSSLVFMIDIPKCVELVVFPELFHSPSPSEVGEAGLNAILVSNESPDERVTGRGGGVRDTRPAAPWKRRGLLRGDTGVPRDRDLEKVPTAPSLERVLREVGAVRFNSEAAPAAFPSSVTGCRFSS